ncbi:MAG: T9SS type A sorting domain-containing protein [Bacteroidota bacterium]
MKKLLFSAALLTSTLGSFASHLMGGQMTSRNLGGLTYEVTLTVYRDTLGIQINPSATFNYVEQGGTFSQGDVVPVIGPVNFGNGVEEYSYIDTITFPNNGSYDMWFEDCCRNFAILNCTQPGGESFHLNNTLLADPTNSSPVFLNPPITLAQLNVPFNYNPMPFDADGDSIVWSVDTPLTAAGIYVQGWTAPSADPLSPFTMNPATGEVSFLPNTQGYFVASFLISEFRGGVQIGEIRRDMQIIVVPSFNVPPVVTSNSTNYPYSGKSFTVAPGTNFSLTVSAYDADGQGINISASGAPLLHPTNPAILATNNGSGTSTATLTWTPDANQARTLPYILAMRIAEVYNNNIFSNDITISIRVGNFAGIDNISSEVVKGIYPNPNNGNFTVEMNSDKAQSVSISISNMIGQQLKVIPQDLNSGVNLLDVKNLNLPRGTYMLSIMSEGKVLQTKSFEIKD